MKYVTYVFPTSGMGDPITTIVLDANEENFFFYPSESQTGFSFWLGSEGENI